MRTVATHGVTAEVASELGYRTERALSRAAERLRDRACPHPRPLEVEYELALLGELEDDLYARALGADVEAHAQMLTAMSLQREILDTQCKGLPEPIFPEGVDPGPIGAERGEWTDGLELRSQNRAYRTIARRLDFEDWWAALVMVYRDLDALYTAAAGELRRAQLAHVDHDLAVHYAARHRHAPVAFATRAVPLIRRRAQVRGLLLVPPRWWHEPCPPSVIRLP